MVSGSIRMCRECVEKVEKGVWNLEVVEYQTEEMCVEAVKSDGWALKYVNEQIRE
jgi:hypothetical protein